MLIWLVVLLIFVLTLVSVIPTLYYSFLCVVYFLNRNKFVNIMGKKESKIIILIPAHNEELTITKTIKSCVSLDYPKDKYDIYVILDNCDDDTKQIVIDNKINYLERISPDKRGKGYALEWAFVELNDAGHDGVLIVDADCELSGNSLLAIDNYLASGYQALQLNDISSNPDASSLSYILSVGNFIENEYFSYPKNILKLAVQCRGTGMVFAKTLLKNFPWDANTITEDMEYSIKLSRANVRVCFIREAYVKSEFPDTNRKFMIQRTRWAEGNLSFSKSNAFELMKEGIKSRKKLIFDSGLTLYLISKPLVLLLVFGSLIMSFMASCFFSDFLLYDLFIMNVFIAILLLGYFLSAIAFYGLNEARLRKLFSVPLVLLSLLKVSLRGLKNRSDSEWQKTPRH